ncbi:MAG: ABC transporter permease subunit [Desulfatitalea sp.]
MRATGQRIIVAWSWISSLLLVAAVGSIVGFLLCKGVPVLNLELIFGKTGPFDALLLRKPVINGLLPAVAGTFFLVMTAVALALPVGIAAGIYMSEYSQGRVERGLTLFFDLLAGIPSIVVGLFGFSLTIFLHQHFNRRIYPCLLISALSLAFLVLPYIIRGTQAALENLPRKTRLIAPALGATQLQNIFFVLLPKALDGITSSTILAIGRCAEDTAVIMLTGAVASAGIPDSLLGAYEALPFYIYYISSQYMDQQELLKGYGAATILLLLCTTLFSVSLLIKTLLANSARVRV